MHQLAETRDELNRAAFIASVGDAAAEIAGRWVEDLVIEGEESGMTLTKRAAERNRIDLAIQLAEVLRANLTKFDLANNSGESFEEWMEGL